uniref:PlsC domain-containing protein n=1 Tax=Caenorhabditis tropicalis TaxID=1561998 RepID=A0A1I7U117_9PELO
MISSIFYFYGSIITLAYFSTVFLIFFGLSWGVIPHWYLHAISLIQGYFPREKFQNDGRDEIDDEEENDKTADQLAEEQLKRIIDTDLGPCFDTAPTKRPTLLGFKPEKKWSTIQKTIFFAGLFFRAFFLMPVRLGLLLTSFVFVALAGLQTAFRTLSDREKTWVAIVYCRLFCSSMGLVANYRNPQYRPKKPGVAVSNHLTPNDIQILFAGTPHGSSYGYVVTGQKHKGIIGLIEHLVEKLCPSLWLERKCSNDRQGFLAEVLKIAKREGPVLLFPEGFCSNNSKVLQFRKAIFEENVNIYPVAIKQAPEFGDGFWYEDEFLQYLIRTMLNWAVVYDIQYLPMETRKEFENNTMFAGRIQQTIARAAGISSCEYGGNLWYKQEERNKLKEIFKSRHEEAIRQSQMSETSSNLSMDDFEKVLESQCPKLITVMS